MGQHQDLPRRHGHEVAADLGLPVAVSAVLGRTRAFHASLPGAVADNDAWAARKIAVVEQFGHSSLAVGAEFALKGEDVNDRLPAATFAAHGGAVPLLTSTGLALGAVAVSGLPSIHDHALVTAALATALGTRALPGAA